MDFLTLVGSLFEQFGNNLCAFRIKERFPNLHVVLNLAERVGHAAADDDFIGLVQQVIDELNLIRHLGSTEDGQQRPLRMVKNRPERVQFLLHQVTAGPLGQLHAGH